VGTGEPERMSCQQARQRLARVGSEASPAAAGRLLLSHLLDCPACRERALEVDPSLLFALGALSAPEPDWTGFGARVVEGIKEAERSAGLIGRLLDLGLLAPKRLVPALAAAACALLMLVAAWRWSGTGSLGPPRIARVEPAPAPAAGVAPLPVESVASPTARVLLVRLGEEAATPRGPGGAEESDVVLILDEEMEL